MRGLTRVFAVAVVTAVAANCANRGAQPPGGPVEKVAPRVEKVTPESGSVNQRPGSIQFVFSRVINDQTSRGDLSQYFLISPMDGDPRVNWHRYYIDVRPRHGFKPNTAYSITLLPGLADVRGNAMTTGATTVFATGPEFPRFGILGSIFDWAAERPATGALVEAIYRPEGSRKDSVVYVALADSLGQYTLGPFGAGRYTLLGFLDRNNNRILDSGELWDSTTVLITTSRPVVTLLAIARDTFPPRITALTREDSATMRVTFDRGIDPSQQLSAGLFRLQRADSTEIPITSVIGARAASDSAARRDTTTRRDTTAQRDTTTRRDTTAAQRPGAPASVVPLPAPGQRPRPTTPVPVGGRPPTIGPPLPRPPRPAPETAVLLKFAPGSLEAGATYRVSARGVRSVVGRSAPVTRTLTIPKPPPPTAKDSVRGRDTTRTPPKKP